VLDTHEGWVYKGFTTLFALGYIDVLWSARVL